MFERDIVREVVCDVLDERGLTLKNIAIAASFSNTMPATADMLEAMHFVQMMNKALGLHGPDGDPVDGGTITAEEDKACRDWIESIPLGLLKLYLWGYGSQKLKAHMLQGAKYERS